MSLLSRLLGKSPPESAEPAARQAEAPVQSPPRQDPAVRLREEDASLSQAIAAADIAAIGKWVVEGSSTRIRQRAAEAVTDPDQLYELIRATRHGNDKSVYRILAAKRDALLAETRAAQQLQADLDAAAAAIARLAGAPYDPSFPATLGILESRWRALAAQASPELQSAVARHLEAARDVSERHRHAIETAAERQRSETLARQEAQHRREAAVQEAAAAASEEARRREAERSAEQAQREADAAEVRRLVGLLRQAQAALDRGGTARAARLRETIAEKLPEAPRLPPWFERQLQQVDARLEELKDWKTFRVAPKRAELIERMQGLVGADLSPEELAGQIRRLRDEWRTLNRGAGEDASPEWQQFDAAAERAYAPCREHFALQAERRRENQARREALLERLAVLAAEPPGESPDWRALQRAVFEARREWRQYAPVDQSAVKPLQARFHALLRELQAPLEAEYARNVEARRELIARAAELVNLEDTRQAIDESKRLQRAWKAVGLVPRKQDNALWEEFRRHCDAVFERGSQESAAHATALAANATRAAEMCSELERMAGLEGDALSGAAPGIEALRNEFDALVLPRGVARELRQQFSRAADGARDALRRKHAADARQAWAELFEAAARVRAYALAAAPGSAPEVDALRVAAENAVADLGRAPKDAKAILEQRLSAIAAGDAGTDLPANESTLRLLCVRAELLTGLETPAEDQELRREYQMQRLVASMGRGERPASTGFEDLAREWIAVGPVEPSIQEVLFARFERCWNAGDT